MTLTDLAILILATWRVSSLLAYEDGPWMMFDRMRLAIGIMYDADGNSYAQNELANLVKCLWCLSVWVGIVLMVVYLLSVWLLVPLAVSAGAIIVDGIVRNGKS